MRLIVSAETPKQRLDTFLAAQFPALSRSYLQKLIQTQQVRLNGELVKASEKVTPGDCIDLTFPETPSSELIPQAIPLDIIFEDECLLVLNKPAGLVVHPAAGHADGTLVNALLHHVPGLEHVGGADRPGIIHRLDKGTSGLMVIAKTEAARLSLLKQFKDRSIYKQYWALLHGVPSPLEGCWEDPIGRHPQQRQKYAVVGAGKTALTEYKVCSTFAGFFSELRIILHTGRTHQIRVHAGASGHPIVGDAVYGGRRDNRKELPVSIREAIQALNRPALHAHMLKLLHPETREEMLFEAPLAADLVHLLTLLRKVL